MPKVNKILNKLSHYDRSNDIAVQKAFKVFPGDQRCRKQEGHSLWHDQTANVLVDLALLSNDIANVIGNKKGAFTVSIDVRTNLIQCHRENDCMSDFDWSKISAPMSSAMDTCMSLLNHEDESNTFLECLLVSIIRYDRSTRSIPVSLSSMSLSMFVLTFSSIFII